MKEIYLDGNLVLIDDQDAWILDEWKSYIQANGNTKYIMCRKSWNKTTLLHRLIMNAPKGMQVDHINGDGLDNRRQNLRLCTQAENGQHRGAQSNNTTGYKGVTIKNGRYAAQITVNGKFMQLGTFKTAEEAARAYDAAARKYHGPFAYTNL